MALQRFTIPLIFMSNQLFLHHSSNILNKVSKVKIDEIARIAFPSNELSDVIPSKGKLSLHSKYSCLLMKILAFDEDISF